MYGWDRDGWVNGLWYDDLMSFVFPMNGERGFNLKFRKGRVRLLMLYALRSSCMNRESGLFQGKIVKHLFTFSTLL